MTGKTGVHPDCRNSSNPYHECSEFCFKFIAEAKKLAAKNEPAGLKAETRSSQPTSITTSVQTELPDNEKSEPDDLPSGDDNTTTEDQPQVDFTKLTGKQKKLFELRLKMNEARKANQSAMVAEKKRKDGPQESRGISKQKWLDERKKKIGKLLDANGLDMKEAYMLDTQQVAETKYKKWEKEPAPAGWDAPAKPLEVFDLEELDSYSGPVQVKKEPSPKPATSSKPVSSKATAVPKPSTATKPRGSSSRKRKESDSPATSEAFPYENHGFLESSRFMTSFLNQGLERLMHLYEDSCGLNKMLEAKLKKAENTIADQGAITAAKSKHYEDKYKAVTQEAQTAIKKANQEAQLKLDAAQLQHEQDMNSYRERLKGSVVISLLQARLKMAYEARALGFECPSWNVNAWEAKLKDLGGNPVELPVKPVVEESSKAAEMAVDAGGDAENDAWADPRVGAGDEAMIEEGTTP